MITRYPLKIDHTHRNTAIIKHKKEDGFVLVSVIWIAGLIAVMATAFVITVRSHTLSGRNAIYNTRAEYVADGLARFAALKLSSPVSATTPFKLNGETIFCRWSGDATASIAIQDQGGLADLNTASPELMAAILRGLGIDDSKTAGIIGALLDFRDPDFLSFKGDTEPVVFPGKSYGPKNAPFAITAELDQLPEIDDALFHKLVGLVTVYSQQPGIDLTVAPRSLLRFLGSEGESSASLVRFASPSPARTFSIDVTAELKNGARYRRFAIVSVLQQPDRLFAIREWTQGGDIGDPAKRPMAILPCIN